MADPRIPHLLGITLDAEGVAGSQVIAVNTGTVASPKWEKQIKSTTSDKVAVFDAAEFTSSYAVNDIILFQNVGGSVGKSTITINSATGGFQEATMDCAAAPTVAVNL